MTAEPTYDNRRLLDIYPLSTVDSCCKRSSCSKNSNVLVVIKAKYEIPKNSKRYMKACLECAGQKQTQLNGDDIERVEMLWGKPMAHWLEPCDIYRLKEHGCRYCFPNHPWEDDSGIWQHKPI